MTWVTAVAAIVALCVVIIIHELGHYAAAVWTGMKVDRFSVFGIGPPIVRLGTWRGTEFVVSAIPFGAYVQIRGMEADDGSAPPVDRKASQNFRDKPLLARMIVIAGGPIANYVGATLLFFGVFAIAGLSGPSEAIEITAVTSGSAAEQAGVQAGDRLVAIGDVEIDPTREGEDIALASQANKGNDVVLGVVRDGQRLELPASLPAEGDMILGVHMMAVKPRQAVPLGVAARESIAQPYAITRDQLQGLYRLIAGQIKANVSGPVGIVQSIARAADRGFVEFVLMAAFISTLLGMFNLLPLPALDGGRLAFLVYEGVARRRANPRVEDLVHGYGMVALLGLILLVTVGDVRRLIP
ncbi:MAG TPA: RIP metalloprotease [Nannocystaceae bacterium]|nr:RIP metalloprotease [Nannocystaceae bacterium]